MYVGGIVTATNFYAGIWPVSTSSVATSLANTSTTQVGYATTAGFAVTFNTSTLVSQAVNLVNTSTTQVGYATTAGFAVTFNTATLVASAVNLVNTSTAQVGYSANILGGAAGSIPIQSAANTTAFIPLGSVGYVLTAAAGNTATWSAVSGLASGSATTATNLANGTAGQIPYQTAPNTTNFTNNLSYSASGAGSNTAASGQTLVVAAGGLGVTGASYFANNVGIGGNLTVSGIVSIGGVDTISATTASFGTIYLNTASVSNPTSQAVGISATTLDTFSTSTYRSAKYVISVSNTFTGLYQASEVLVVHDGVTPYLQDVSVATGSGNSSAPIMNFSTTITGGNVLLQGTGTANTNTVKVSVVYVTI